MVKKAEWNIKKSSFMAGTRASLFSDYSLCRICVILDLGDCEAFSVDYMEVVQYFPCFRGRFWGADYPRVHIIRGV